MDDLYNLMGKTAWITGGKRIGQKIAEILAKHGANIIISYNKSNAEANETISKIKKFGVKTLSVQVDVSSRESVIQAVKKIKKQFKRVDILVLMASVFEKVKFQELSLEDFQKNFDVHVMGTFWPIRESLSIMPNGSHIITISDRTFLGNVYRDFLPYIVTKGAVASLTKALSIELAQRGIFINSIGPGPVLKPDYMLQRDWDKIRSASIIKYPITDREAVEEFAKLVLYLSTARSTGAVYPLDFGHL